MTYSIQATPIKCEQTPRYYTQNTGRHDLTRSINNAKRFETFVDANETMQRLRCYILFSDVTLSVLK